MALQEQGTAGEQLIIQADRLAEQVTIIQYLKQPDLVHRFGAKGRDRTKQDSMYSLSYLAESVLLKSPALFMNYISWLKLLLRGYRVTEQDLVVNLLAIRSVLLEHFHHQDRQHVIQYLDLGIDYVAQADAPVCYVTADAPLGAEAATYLDQLLHGDRKLAYAGVVDLLAQGISIKDIYLYIFQTAQYEVGRLWQTGEINVAQEHYCTAATQSIMSRLYPQWLSAHHATQARRLVSACVGNEMHEMGIRMLTDFFEMEGWDTYYLGANVPDRSLLEAIIAYKADLVAISVTMTFHVHLVQQFITTIRSSKGAAHVKIIVGGLPFNIDRELWKKVGADGYAPDADGATKLADTLVPAAGQQ